MTIQRCWWHFLVSRHMKNRKLISKVYLHSTYRVKFERVGIRSRGFYRPRNPLERTLSTFFQYMVFSGAESFDIERHIVLNWNYQTCSIKLILVRRKTFENWHTIRPLINILLTYNRNSNLEYFFTMWQSLCQILSSSLWRWDCNLQSASHVNRFSAIIYPQSNDKS